MKNVENYKMKYKNMAQSMVWATENNNDCELSVYLPMASTKIVNKKTNDELVFIYEMPDRFGFAFDLNGYHYGTNTYQFCEQGYVFLKDNDKGYGRTKNIDEKEFIEAFCELLKQYGGKTNDIEKKYLSENGTRK